MGVSTTMAVLLSRRKGEDNLVYEVYSYFNESSSQIYLIFQIYIYYAAHWFI